MFDEQLGKLVADHLRSHIAQYLQDIDDEYSGSDKVNLVVPKSIEYASVVGGLWTEFNKILPQYGIDVLNIIPSQDDSALFTFEYAGQINGMVSAASREAVDKLCSRHGRAVYRFINDHQFMHEHQNSNFRVIEMVWAGTDFSGAEDLSQQDTDLWVAGFSHNVSWFLSQDGPQQHG